MPRLNRDQLHRDELHSVRFELNGRAVVHHATPRTLLSDFLRHAAGATGTHVGCEHGVCGACTVRVDGELARSCLMLAVQVDGASVETVEGLSHADGSLSDLQRAFKRHHALQCGYCTPGILISLEDFLGRHPQPDEDELRDMLSGHLCRCTGYTPIVEAAMEVAAARWLAADGVPGGRGASGDNAESVPDA